MMEFSEILKAHDRAYIASQETRERAADDLIFSRVTQWSDDFDGVNLEYRGQFDKIRKARRQNLSEMRANPVQVSYIPGRDADDDTADLLERAYRHDMSTPAAKQAGIIAQQDQVDCGYGAWRMATDYIDSVTNEQCIKREPIHEANNRVFRDPDGNMPDGSDDNFCTVIWTVTAEGWPEFAKQIGVDPDESPSDFRPPEDGYSFPWGYDNNFINIGEFYGREEVTRKAYLFENMAGTERLVKAEDLERIFDELREMDYQYVEEREYKTWEVTKYWVSGGGILKSEVVAGTAIPIIHLYGEVSKVQGNWVWEGIVRLAKDPQRLRNFMMSYIADIAANGAQQRPYFRMSQIAGLEWQFERGGPDDNRPFRVLNDFDEDGNPLEGGPVSYEKPPDMPQAAVGLLEASDEAIADVADPGLPQDVGSTELSGKAVTAMQNRLDMQTYVYIDNFALALQREAEIYASMVPGIYDTPRELGLLSEDGTEEVEQVNAQIFDFDSGKLVTTYDLTQGEYSVRTKVTASYSSRRDQQRAQKIELYAASEGNPEAQNVLLLEIMLLDDNESEISKKWARWRLLDMGILEPESEDDEDYLKKQEAAKNNQEPDAMMVAAQAEQAKAQADMMSAQNDQAKAQTAQFSAETDRYKVMLQAKEMGIDMQMKGVDARKTTAETAQIMQEMQTKEITIDLAAGA